MKIGTSSEIRDIFWDIRAAGNMVKNRDCPAKFGTVGKYGTVRVKVKVQVYSLISSLKTYHPTLHLTPWSLDLFFCVPFQLHREHTVPQPFRRIELIVHIAISVLPGTHFHRSQVKHLRVKCLAQGHNILTMSQD